MTFTWRGVRITLSFWFFWGAAWLLLRDRAGLFRLFFGAAALHEGGHLLYMALAGLPLGEVRLTPLGLNLTLRGELPLSPGRELLLNLSGCAANLLAAALFPCLPGGGMGALRFSAVNLALGAANLLPVPGLDGAQALAALLELALGWEQGERAARLLLRGCCLLGAAAVGLSILREGAGLPQLCLLGVLLSGLLPGRG